MAYHPEEIAAEFWARYPQIKHIDLRLSDLNGIPRGKRVAADTLAKVLAEGIYLPASVFALDVTGDTVEGTGLGFRHGDADRNCRVIEATLTPSGWRHRPVWKVRTNAVLRALQRGSYKWVVYSNCRVCGNRRPWAVGYGLGFIRHV